MKTIKMTRNELVWETRVAYFDRDAWKRTLDWLKQFADKPADEYTWEGRWALVYNRVKDMTFEDVMADFEAYEDENNIDNYIVFSFKNKYFDGEECEYEESLHDLIIDWLRDDCIDSEVIECDYADDYEENIKIADLND
jgi:hypothetical protein